MAERKEETKRASNNYFIDFRLKGGKRTIQEHFEKGAQWSDEHPREGLWDANKVLAWISQNIGSYCKLDAKNFNNLLFDLRKAMED